MIEERCRKGHTRTPANTYRSPDGRQHCRVCSGTSAGTTSAHINLRGHTSEVFTPAKLADLRWQVRCLVCSAVPYDTGETRTTSNQHGDSVTLPVIRTDHADECSVAAQSPRRGRPRALKSGPEAQRPCGDCSVCSQPMTSTHGRPRKYCSDACRMKAKRARAKAATS